MTVMDNAATATISAPTERSMLPVMITKAMPKAMMPMTEFERMMLMMLLSDRKVKPFRQVETTTISNVTSRMLYSPRNFLNFCLEVKTSVVCITLYLSFLSSPSVPPVASIMIFSSVSSSRLRMPRNSP